MGFFIYFDLIENNLNRYTPEDDLYIDDEYEAEYLDIEEDEYIFTDEEKDFHKEFQRIFEDYFE